MPSNLTLPEGTILHLQRLSTEDGPGIRTTVFFKGCPLRCGWCHNPESLSPGPQVQWIETHCIGCGLCIRVCPQAGIRRDEQGTQIDYTRCTGCGTCADECPANGLERLGRRVTAPALVEELLRDRAYFQKSGGGVTLSGGEPTLQPDFCGDVLRLLQQARVHTALDTCGLCSPEVLARLLPHTDLILFDLKEIDPEHHRRLTHQTNERILHNLRWLAEQLRQHPGPRPGLWIRTPLIPGATATPANLAGIGAFLARHLDGLVERWELCAFNNLCRDKYRRLGLEWEFAATPLLTQAELDECAGWATASGFDPARVLVTGAARST